VEHRDSRVFTLEEVNDLVPKLSVAVKEQLERRSEIESLLIQLGRELGAVLKDARMGLLDFYGTVDGKLVWLCWRYGESEVAHYHALTEGFSGRKPIAQSMRSRHLN